MCGGKLGNFLSNPWKATRKQIGRTAKQTGKFIRNPADALLGENIRNSSIYRNIARPVIKTGTGALSGFVASGFNPAGAVYGGLTSALGGGLNNKGFNPISNIALPAVAGYFGGNENNYIADALGFGADATAGVTGAVTDIGQQAAQRSAELGGSLVARTAPALTEAATSSFALPTSIPEALGMGKDLLGKAITNPQLLGAGLQIFGGTQELPGQVNAGQKDLAATELTRLSNPEAIRTQISQIRQNPQIKIMLGDLRTRVTEQVRNEFMSAYGSQLSASGGWSSSQQQQLEQQMAGELTKRLAREENNFLMNQLGTELSTTGQAATGLLATPPSQSKRSNIGNIGKLIAAL